MADYRPAPGETLFASLHGNRPKVIKVLEYFWHDELPKEQLRYICGDGTKEFYTVEYVKFYPDVPLNTKYIYMAQAKQYLCDYSTEDYELGYFFKPEEAFHYIRCSLAGEAKLPRGLPNIHELDFFVTVEEV